MSTENGTTSLCRLPRVLSSLTAACWPLSINGVNLWIKGISQAPWWVHYSVRSLSQQCYLNETKWSLLGTTGSTGMRVGAGTKESGVDTHVKGRDTSISAQETCMKGILRRGFEVDRGRLKVQVGGFIKESGKMTCEKDSGRSSGTTSQYIMGHGKQGSRISGRMCGRTGINTQGHGKDGRWKEKARWKWHRLEKC